MAKEKLKKVVKNLVAQKMQNGGKKKPSVAKAMRVAGYSKAYSRNPQKLKKNKTWNELMEEHLPDDFLAEKHKSLLNAKTIVKVTIKGKRTVITEHEDTDALGRGLDLAYKIKGKFKPIQVDIRSFVGWTPAELEAYAANGSVPERFRAKS